MIFGHDRKQLRKMYFDSWHKAEEGKVLTPLETEIVEVLKMHPEYHPVFLGDSNDQLDKDFNTASGDENPFLHMGLHLGIREQLSTNRPSGITSVFRKIVTKVQHPHDAEHIFMEILGEFIWRAQQQGKAPDEVQYLAKLKERVTLI